MAWVHSVQESQELLEMFETLGRRHAKTLFELADIDAGVDLLQQLHFPASLGLHGIHYRTSAKR
jgi:hypothetical protein